MSLPLTGHVHPSLALVRELVTRGDEIVYYSTPAYRGRIEGAQAEFRPYSNAFLNDLTRLPERLHELSWLLVRTTEEVLESDLEAFGSERPDYVITDSVAPWGQWVAQILHVPVVTSISTMAFNRRVLMFAAKHGIQPRNARLVVAKLQAVAKALMIARRLRRRYGVRGTGVMDSVAGRSDLNIVYTSRYFQPCAETFDDRFAFVGPSFSDRQENDEFPWELVRRDTDLVYISLGTLFNVDAAFYRMCFDAFKDENVQVVLSIGGNTPIASLGTVPNNFIVRSHVPQLEVLGRTAVFVTHSGMNSVSESLSNGVPMVVIPQMSEQAMVGRRVEELGAGVYLAKESVTPETLRHSVLRVGAEPEFRAQAALVQASFQAAGGVSQAADAIFAYTGR